MRTSQYKNLKFKNETEFYAWLDQKTRTIIELKDLGHDVRKFWIDEHGEILDCKSYSPAFIGKFIDNDNFKEGYFLSINDEMYRGMVIENVTKC